MCCIPVSSFETKTRDMALVFDDARGSLSRTRPLEHRPSMSHCFLFLRVSVSVRARVFVPNKRQTRLKNGRAKERRTHAAARHRRDVSFSTRVPINNEVASVFWILRNRLTRTRTHPVDVRCESVCLHVRVCRLLLCRRWQRRQLQEKESCGTPGSADMCTLNNLSLPLLFHHPHLFHDSTPPFYHPS